MTEKRFDIDVLGIADSTNNDISIGSYFITGHVKHQWYGSVDLQELYKAGGKIIYVHSGLGFKKSIANPFRNFVQTFFDARVQYKKDGSVMEQAVKLILNSSYGKTVTKLIATKISVSSEQEFLT